MKTIRKKLRKNKKGFTLIELSFAVLFISVLMLTVTLIINEIVSIYRKGYAIKTVNSVGRDLIDDFSDALSQTSSGSFADYCEYLYKDYRDENNRPTNGYENCMKDAPSPGMKTIYQQFYTSINVSGSSSTSFPYGGMLCTGSYSYIYQSGYMKTPELTPGIAGIEFEYTDSSGSSQRINDFSLLKVTDPSRSLCRGNLDDNYQLKETMDSTTTPGRQYRVITMPESLGDSDEPIELLLNSDVKLALYSLAVSPPAHTASTDRMLYSMSFILATVSDGVNINRSSGYCTEPNYNSINFSYCAINKFNFTIQANGGGRKR